MHNPFLYHTIIPSNLQPQLTIGFISTLTPIKNEFLQKFNIQYLLYMVQYN